MFEYIKRWYKSNIRFPYKMLYKAFKYIFLMLKGDIPYEEYHDHKD